jgi:uroporphyrinogen-III synthase
LSGTVLIARPEPGASETAARARRIGLTPVVAPLFEVRALPWVPPDPDRHDAILFTSAHPPRLAGADLGRFTCLPAYAVGEASARAARDAGFADVRTGSGDGAALIARAAADGVRRALHLCGRENLPLRHPQIEVEQCVVYAAEEIPGLVSVPPGAVVLLHSPRAAAAFAARVAERGGIALALISDAAAAAAGDGWAAKAVAGEPRDEALLEVARRLCQKEPPDAAGAGAGA